MVARATPGQLALLGVLLVVFAAAVYYNLGATGAPPPAGKDAVAQAVPSRAAAARDQAESAPPVRLAQLKADRPAVADGGRNLFREKPKPPPPAPKVAPTPPPDPNAPPPPPPPPPPITLKLIGIVQGSGKPIAALSDGKDVFYGREGDIIEGRYRIIKVNVESIDIAYVDGRGQRRLGLSG
jgi:hypothetical protein